MLDLESVKQYLRIDFDSDDNYVIELIEVSSIYIETCVGVAYKADLKAVKLAELLQNKLINDMYENRSAEVTGSIKQDRIVTTILDKLSNFI
ncbi:head-tail connector protein [Clostridium sp. CF012]|uniref:head-tail connector protein n=1 Tax=Clostridium sp. CF012 TaxID=2843319 RepID=UPI001C0D4E11|nr:head-tail connector protein [Clostridium sp. CF012]MBU3145730.1 head-tail connector protein [Clostridium sp. CF012]